ncbi:hypothetical protein EDB85DRAFT_386325 [Lactarius pseudohatsudake]|nr:hypothetical protein EDB85DRAFT_386325 [Lactarius pseudohatsudake]
MSGLKLVFTLAAAAYAFVRTPALSDHSRGIRYPSLPYNGTPRLSHFLTTVVASITPAYLTLERLVSHNRPPVLTTRTQPKLPHLMTTIVASITRVYPHLIVERLVKHSCPPPNYQNTRTKTITYTRTKMKMKMNTYTKVNTNTKANTKTKTKTERNTNTSRPPLMFPRACIL